MDGYFEKMNIELKNKLKNLVIQQKYLEFEQLLSDNKDILYIPGKKGNNLVFELILSGCNFVVLDIFHKLNYNWLIKNSVSQKNAIEVIIDVCEQLPSFLLKNEWLYFKPKNHNNLFDKLLIQLNNKKNNKRDLYILFLEFLFIFSIDLSKINKIEDLNLSKELWYSSKYGSKEFQKKLFIKLVQDNNTMENIFKIYSFKKNEEFQKELLQIYEKYNSLRYLSLI